MPDPKRFDIQLTLLRPTEHAHGSVEGRVAAGGTLHLVRRVIQAGPYRDVDSVVVSHVEHAVKQLLEKVPT